MSAPPRAPGENSYPDRSLDGVQVERGRRGLRIARHWSKAAGYGMLFWVAVWFGMVHFFTSLGNHESTALTSWLALPGIAMAYAALTRILNRTVIDLTPTVITVQHTPLPWHGRRTIPRRDIKALHVEVKRIYAKPNYDEYWILVERHNGKKTMLLKGLEMSALQMSGIAATMSDYLEVPVYSGQG